MSDAAPTRPIAPAAAARRISISALCVVGICGLLVASGCARYRSVPLARGSGLASSLAQLDVELPAGAGAPSRIAIDRPLGIDEIGLLAILNDPDLKSERGTREVARAALLQASLLPNPSVGLAYAALLGGPGTTPAFTASLSQDIASILTYRIRVAAARAHIGEVDADLLWREWQVAQKARLTALDIASLDRSIDLSRRALDDLSVELRRVRAATAAGNLDDTALAPVLVATAALEQSLATLTLGRLKDWQALDALLGLTPDVRFALAPPVLPPLPGDVDRLVASLPERRPDLVALGLGYRSSQASVRAAVFGQFPAFALGVAGGSDTTGVVSAGPTATFDLPIFDRGQGRIAQVQATRLLLREQYQSRLDSAVGTIAGLVARQRLLAAALIAARRAAASAAGMSERARRAYAQNNLDQRALTDYETTTLQRELEVIALERTLDEDQITITVELGLGLPTTTIAPQDPPPEIHRPRR
jgi:outer membrane protein TolC